MENMDDIRLPEGEGQEPNIKTEGETPAAAEEMTTAAAEPTPAAASAGEAANGNEAAAAPAAAETPIAEPAAVTDATPTASATGEAAFTPPTTAPTSPHTASAQPTQAGQGGYNAQEPSRVSYTPDGNYNPHGGYGVPPRRPQGPAAPCAATPPRRNNNARITVLCSLLAVVLLVASFFGGAAIGRMTSSNPTFSPSGEQTGGGTQGNNQGGTGDAAAGINRGDVYLNVIERESAVYGDYDIPTVVEKVQDTVVEIRTETTVTSAYYGDYVKSGAGSGVIIAENGLILTCEHVISGAGSITVVLTDGREYTASVYGQDSWSDLALLKIEASGLRTAEIRSTVTKEDVAYKDYLAVGEEVIAIGNPLGELGGSVSNGIISALGRKVSIEGVPMTLMQTNAAVNPGNSGGGLFNMYGELIGIVNAKSTGDSVEGIGFAIPISDAYGIFTQLYSQGYVSGRPYLGLYFESTTSGLKILSYDYNDELTGGQTIQNGDLLYSADGTIITTLADLKTVLAGKKVGDTMVIHVERIERKGYTYVRTPLEFTLTIHEYVPVTQ